MDWGGKSLLRRTGLGDLCFRYCEGEYDGWKFSWRFRQHAYCVAVFSSK